MRPPCCDWATIEHRAQCCVRDTDIWFNLLVDFHFIKVINSHMLVYGCDWVISKEKKSSLKSDRYLCVCLSMSLSVSVTLTHTHTHLRALHCTHVVHRHTSRQSTNIHKITTRRKYGEVKRKVLNTPNATVWMNNVDIF